jgi:hypothetical protein
LILGRQFLEELSDGDDAADSAVARFEYALLTAGGRSTDDEVVIDWPCDPEEF